MSGYTAATMLAVSLASTAVSAIGSAQQAKQQQASLDYQSQIAERNATLAQQNADASTEQGRMEAKTGHENKLKKRQEVAGVIAGQRSAMSASGALLDSGSILDLNIDTAEKGEIDAMKMEQEGFDRQYQYDVQAQNFLNQASGYSAEGQALSSQADSINPYLNAGGTLLQGVALAGANYGMMTQGATTKPKTFSLNTAKNNFFSKA